MATVQPKKNPGSRIDVRNGVLARATTVAVTPVNKKLAAFDAVHREFLAADAAVTQAEQAVQRQQAEIGALDAVHDETIDELANARAGDGAPRMNPFKALGFPGPSAI